MPFSWKKKTRFSQLVADHLQSPKRGGSLVVETGFPTSLIDLYVRNRGRFRKSSPKKQRGNDSPTPLSSLSSLSSSSDSLLSSNNLSSGASDYRRNDEIIEEDVVLGENSSKTEVERSVEMAKLNPVLVSVLKLLFMVVLALGTKRLKVGITVSAFLLFFLELVGKPLLGRWSLISSGVDSSNFHGTKNTKSSEQNTSVVVCSEVLEIEEQVDSKQEVRSEKELDEVRSEVLTEIRHKSSRKALMKSRMKKLVPKKLRKSSNGEICSVFNEEETVKCTNDLKPLILPSERSYSEGQIFCISKQEQDKIVEIQERSSSSSSTLILFLIVLVGLIGGRVLALVLALSWCLMLKTSQWRNVKFPIS